MNYFHSQTLHDFNGNWEGEGEYQAFYKFTLKQEIRCDDEIFAISVI